MMHLYAAPASQMDNLLDTLNLNNEKPLTSREQILEGDIIDGDSHC